jgi:hypothetical protein
MVKIHGRKACGRWLKTKANNQIKLWLAPPASFILQNYRHVEWVAEELRWGIFNEKRRNAALAPHRR